MNFETISVVGLGYIGLPTAAVLAARKKRVIGVDVQEEVVETINRGQIHIVEPELDIVVRAAVTEGFLRATTVPEEADAHLIAVPTPFASNHDPDLKYVEAASRAIAPVLRQGDLVIVESTSPVGTTERVSGWLAEERPDLRFPHAHGEDTDVCVAYCPERVLPGRVLHELVENDRVIGGLTPRCSEAAVELYKIFVDGECVVTDAPTAEMVKLTENSFRDVNIAFANELSIICDKIGVDVWELIALANRHPRVDILKPGPGVGGHCIAVDPWFIVSRTPEEARLIRTAREINDSKPALVVEAIKKKAADLGTNRVVCLGATFKPDIDDMRESPALEVIKSLLKCGYDVSLVEPNIEALPADLEAGECRLLGLDQALAVGPEAVTVILVAHREFRECRPPRDGNVLDVCGALKA